MTLLHSALAALLVLAGPAPAAPDPAAARAYLATIEPSPDLQAFLDRTVESLLAHDRALRGSAVRVALLDLPSEGPPRLAQRGGDVPMYPSSVVKFVYLMAAYAWQERGALRIESELDDALTHMIQESSNAATQRALALITGAQPGPPLDTEAYAEFRRRRLTIDDWLRTLGIDDLHCVAPTYDDNGDMVGRDEQFLKDRSIAGALPSHGTEYPNRNAMTALGTVKLLALLATDRALTAADSATVRHRMQRDLTTQPHLVHRITGGAARTLGLQVYAKSGTWGPSYADAGIVRDASGRQFALAVFTERKPAYRGEFIAELTHRAVQELLVRRAP